MEKILHCNNLLLLLSPLFNARSLIALFLFLSFSVSILLPPQSYTPVIMPIVPMVLIGLFH